MLVLLLLWSGALSLPTETHYIESSPNILSKLNSKGKRIHKKKGLQGDLPGKDKKGYTGNRRGFSSRVQQHSPTAGTCFGFHGQCMQCRYSIALCVLCFLYKHLVVISFHHFTKWNMLLFLFACPNCQHGLMFQDYYQNKIFKRT